MRNISNRKFMCRLVFQANSNSFLHFILGSIALLCFAPPVKKRRKRKGETLSFSLSSFPFPSGLRFLDLALGDTAGARESPNTFSSEKRILHLNSAFIYGKKTELPWANPPPEQTPSLPSREERAEPTLSFSLSHREGFFCSFFPPFALVWIGFDGRRRTAGCTVPTVGGGAH